MKYRSYSQILVRRQEPPEAVSYNVSTVCQVMQPGLVNFHVQKVANVAYAPS